MSKNSVVYKLTVEFTESDVSDIIDTINDGDELTPPLTLKEVKSNKKLLKYLIESLDLKQMAMYDLGEIWNGDGWCDVKDYRNIESKSSWRK